MITSLMVERMPQASSHMLSGGTIQGIIAGILIIRLAITLCLNQHRVLTPRPAGTTRRIMRIPVIHVITPLSGKVGFLRIQFTYAPALITILRMSELYVVIFTSLCRSITGCIAVWIWIFLVYDTFHLLGKVVRIPSLVEDRFPKPHTRTVSISSYNVSDITIHIVGEARFRIPELPSRGIFDHKQSQFITSIHKGRVLRIMSISDDTQSGIFQFLGISPM